MITWLWQIVFNRNSEPRWKNKSLKIYDGATTTNIYQKMGRGGKLTHFAWPPGIELGPGRITISSCNECVSSRPGNLKKRKTFRTVHPLRGCNSIYFVILWNGIDSNLRRSECKVLVILEIPRNGVHEDFAKITHICLHQIGLFLVLYSLSHVWFEQCFHCVSMLLDWMVCSCYSHHASESAGTDPHIHALSIAHTCCHTHVPRRRVAEREVYIP